MCNLHMISVQSDALKTFIAIYGLAPQYITELLLPFTPAHSFRSAGTGLLVVP